MTRLYHTLKFTRWFMGGGEWDIATFGNTYILTSDYSIVNSNKIWHSKNKISLAQVEIRKNPLKNHYPNVELGKIYLLLNIKALVVKYREYHVAVPIVVLESCSGNIRIFLVIWNEDKHAFPDSPIWNSNGGGKKNKAPKPITSTRALYILNGHYLLWELQRPGIPHKE